MKKFFFRSFLFWFVLLFLAILNATVREYTYKPILTPVIGIWAHQISSIIAVVLFFGAIYFLLKKTSFKYSVSNLLAVGAMWVVLTLIFEVFMNSYIRKLNFEEILATYYFWRGDLWVFVLLSLMVIPQIVKKLLKR